MERETSLSQEGLIESLKKQIELFERNRSISFKLADVEGARVFITKRNEARQKLDELMRNCQ